MKPILFSILFLFFSCGQKESRAENKTNAPISESSSLPDKEMPGEDLYSAIDAYKSDNSLRKQKNETGQEQLNVSSSAASISNDGQRKVIRKARLKFSTHSVISTTYTIEDMVARHRGFVAFTDLKSEILRVEKVAVSKDSMLETTEFVPKNYMTVRIPQAQLDSFLKDLSGVIGFLDYRVIEAKDISLQLLSNELERQRLASYDRDLSQAIGKRGGKLSEITDASQAILDKQQASDEAHIATLRLMDQVELSTVELNLYQAPVYSVKRVVSSISSPVYEPSFGEKMTHSLKSGWDMVGSFVLFLAKIWVLLLVSIAAWILYRGMRRKSKV